MTSPESHLVCVVDDDQAVRESLVLLLSSCGFEAVGFGDAEEFLAANVVAIADLLIVDVGLPGMSGIDLLEHLHSEGISRPVLVITGHADDQDVQKASQSNLVAFMQKPVNPRDLIDVIRRCLDGSE